MRRRRHNRGHLSGNSYRHGRAAIRHVGITTFQPGAGSGRLHGRAGMTSCSDGLCCAFSVASHGAPDPAAKWELPGAAGDYDPTSRLYKPAGTVPKRQDTGVSNGALADSAGGYLVACIERESFHAVYQRAIGNGEVVVQCVVECSGGLRSWEARARAVPAPCAPASRTTHNAGDTTPDPSRTWRARALSRPAVSRWYREHHHHRRSHNGAR